jgi:hypothetical protein
VEDGRYKSVDGAGKNSSEMIVKEQDSNACA